jgi:hypothetical protein
VAEKDEVAAAVKSMRVEVSDLRGGGRVSKEDVREDVYTLDSRVG